MNRRKIQLGLCRALLDSLELYGAQINEDEYAVANRHIGYVFDCKEFVLDTGKIEYSDKIADIFKDREDDVELERTDRLRDCKKAIAVEFDAGGFAVYANLDFVNTFKGCQFYAYSPTGRVLVKDGFGKTIGLFMPMIIPDKKKTPDGGASGAAV